MLHVVALPLDQRGVMRRPTTHLRRVQNRRAATMPTDHQYQEVPLSIHLQRHRSRSELRQNPRHHSSAHLERGQSFRGGPVLFLIVHAQDSAVHELRVLFRVGYLHGQDRNGISERAIVIRGNS